MSPISRVGFRSIQAGDVLQLDATGDTYVVLLGQGHDDADTVVVTRTLSISNPDEWSFVSISSPPDPAAKSAVGPYEVPTETA